MNLSKAEVIAARDAIARTKKRLDAIQFRCDTCAHWIRIQGSQPVQMTCNRWQRTPPADFQKVGCDEWIYDDVPF